MWWALWILLKKAGVVLLTLFRIRICVCFTLRWIRSSDKNVSILMDALHVVSLSHASNCIRSVFPETAFSTCYCCYIEEVVTCADSRGGVSATKSIPIFVTQRPCQPPSTKYFNYVNAFYKHIQYCSVDVLPHLSQSYIKHMCEGSWNAHFFQSRSLEWFCGRLHQCLV